MEPRDLLDMADPDMVCETEYRVIHELVEDCEAGELELIQAVMANVISQAQIIILRAAALQAAGHEFRWEAANPKGLVPATVVCYRVMGQDEADLAVIHRRDEFDPVKHAGLDEEDCQALVDRYGVSHVVEAYLSVLIDPMEILRRAP